FLIGHNGRLFEFKDLSIRLVLFIVLMAIWFGKKIFQQQPIYALRGKLALPFSILLFFIVFGAWRGLLTNGSTNIVFGDIVNYLYILLFLPFSELIRDFDFKKKLIEVMGGAVLALFLLSLITLILFSSGILFVHEPSGFYWWFRQVLDGKITKIDFNFYRIVTSAHLLILPIFLIYLSSLMNKKINGKFRFSVAILAALASFIILVNFGRAYLMGLIFGLLFLVIGISWKYWLRFELVVILLLIIEMVVIVFCCSRFQVSSINLVEERLNSIFGPSEELSVLTREQRLIATKNLLSRFPILGTGLGTFVSFFDPNAQKEQITYHLDWGYLEIWLELSIFGLISFLYFIYLVIKRIILLARSDSGLNQRLLVGLGSGLLALVVATLTGPYLFHCLGMAYLVLSAALVNQENFYGKK
ncbi:MAG: O-antigen ligase family protein, partial [Minisyncoccia bacterium]